MLIDLTSNCIKTNSFAQMSTINRFHYQLGFTIIEAMIAVALLGITIAIGVPSFQATIEKNRILNESQRIFTIIKQARNNAIQSGTMSFICRTGNIVTGNTGNYTCALTSNGINVRTSPEWNIDLLMYSALPNTNVPNPNTRFQNQRINILYRNSNTSIYPSDVDQTVLRNNQRKP